MSEMINEKRRRELQRRYHEQIKRQRFSIAEGVVWISLAFVLWGAIAVRWYNGDWSLKDPDSYKLLAGAIAAVLLPWFYKLIFDMFPAQAWTYSLSDSIALIVKLRTRNLAASKSGKGLHPDVVGLIAKYAEESGKLSRQIFNRAGVYLLIGVLVAFTGLATFYILTVQASGGADAPILTNLIHLLPKLGILLFVELIAFFFLRQYRVAMDEFRYYEAVKRAREETVALLRIAEEAGVKLDPLELAKSGFLFSKVGLLQKGESTEIIESKKLEKSELELFEKLVDVIARSKR